VELRTSLSPLQRERIGTVVAGDAGARKGKWMPVGYEVWYHGRRVSVLGFGRRR